MSDEQLSDSSMIKRHEANIRAHDFMINAVEGVIHSQYVGLVHATVRIRVGRRVDLLVKLAINDVRCFLPGESVIARFLPRLSILRRDYFVEADNG